ncbi:TetR/AcrR family transcriptional regulator [Robertmurraya korlensis]|uniref:TetR/AcrR family transcriptional regulator n=1 Tax=Robertmurraya korlensis TaxID=519977 RepID=UPI000824F325|nr:TetR/AcrR family transcriptional regulator [Robertmurraya korlensis]
MNDRKQHVINTAHQLFVEKGFQATSIQDILDYSSISKGTFYNYFSSKNELLMAIFRDIQKKFEHERNELLVGKDPADIEVFINQMVLQVKTHRATNLIPLYEEVLFLNDVELKKFIGNIQIRLLRWVYERLNDIFGESNKPYLLDGAIMFTAILHHNLKYERMANRLNSSPERVVRYSVNRLVILMNDVNSTGEQLLPPEILEEWSPSCHKKDKTYHEKLTLEIMSLKKELVKDKDLEKYVELLDFVQEELLQSDNKRPFVVESALAAIEIYFGKDKLQRLRSFIQ